MTKKSAERARRGRAASQAGLCYVRSAVRAVIRLRRIGQRGERDGEVKEASSTATSTARGVARQGADSVTHSTDGRRRRVRAMPLFTDARRPAALPRLWRCAWRRAPSRRRNHAPNEARRRRLAPRPVHVVRRSWAAQNVWRVVGYFAVPPSRVGRAACSGGDDAACCVALDARGAASRLRAVRPPPRHQAPVA